MPPSTIESNGCVRSQNKRQPGSPRLYHRSEVPKVYREPFIINGYRQGGCSYLDCLRYSLTLHNDVGNFWTHFLPLFIWLPWLYQLSHQHDFRDPYFYPLLCFWAGSCSYAFFSSVAHLLASKSFTVRTVCFILDYHGIAMYGFGAGMASLYYEQPMTSVLFQYKWPLLIGEVVFAINAVFLCGLSRFYWLKWRFIVRAAAFVFPYLSSVLPILYRLYVCLSTGANCVHETIPLHLYCFVAAFFLIFFFVTKIPERFAPGRFDYFGQSHQLFHICAIILTSLQMRLITIDMVLRRDALASINFTADFNSSCLLYALVQLSGLLCVGVFGVLVKMRVLISNKTDVVEELLKSEKHD